MSYFTSNHNLPMSAKVAILLLAIVLLVGIFFLLTAFLPHAKKKTRKTMSSFNKRGKTKTESKNIDSGLTVYAQKLAKYIHLNDIERSELQQALQITGNPLTPEEYRATCVIAAGIFLVLGGVVALAGALMSSSMFIVIGLGGCGLGVFYYFYLNKVIKSDKENVVEGVDRELPRFVSFMNTALQNQNSSILAILERYTPQSERFTMELEQTIADAKTSNFNGAMARWDQRMNSDRLKRVIRGLVNANNGDDVRVYFAMLERDFNSYEMVLLKQNIKRIPERMRLPKMLMYSSVALALFFPIIMQVVESFSLFFG